MALQNAFGNIALDASVQEVVTAVEALQTTIDNGVLVSGSVVALDAPTLSALETITANTGGLTNAELRASAIEVSVSSSPLPTDAATQTTLAAIDAKLGATLSVNVGLTDTQLRANPVPVEIQGALGTAGTKALGTPPVDGDIGLVTNTVIHGLTTGGGGGYVDVKVTPSGALTVEVGDTVLPIGAATDATLQAVLSLQNEIRDLNDTLITLLSGIFEKMPRVTGNDQAAVSIETGTVAVSSLPTLGTVTTVATVTSVTNQVQMGGQEALTLARANIMSGTSHIYNNIEVS